LTELRIDNTDVSTLDITNNVQLDWLKVNGSLITTLDLTGLTVLTKFEGQTGILENIDIRNGNNTNITTFNVTNNSNLDCVLVDDAAYSTTNWTDIPSGLIFSETYCRYTAIPDANFEARLDALGYDDISADGQVPTALIEVVTELTANGLSISDFTGLEDFTNLTSLNVGNNNITSIDLSNLPLLEFLRVDGNPLTSLDISTNTALVDLRCSFVSAMTSIDISNNTLLETAHISNNSIASLDVSNNPLLYWLQINSTPITNIDLSANTALREFQCTNGVLASLDVSANIALEELILSNNTLPSLDLSANTALRILYISGTGLTSLNLQNGNNTNIIDYVASSTPNLSCVLVDDESYSNTNWTVRDPGTSFSDTYCRYTAIPDANFEAELETLGYDDISGDGQVPTPLIEGITSLAVPNKNISDLTGIEDFVALTSLNCRLNNLTALDVSQNVLLSTLTADSNSIAAIDLSNNTDLQILNLAGSNLTTIDVSNNTLLRKLFVQGNSGLTSIDISNNTQLVEFRTNNTGIAALDLSVHPDLELLECYGSPLASIELSNNLLLENLRLENTNITALDLTNNTNIISLRVNDTAIETLDLSNQTALQTLYANDTSLSSLNVQNGNNTNITTFIANNNPNLNCILVDDAAYSTTNWTTIDPTVTFRDGNYCRYTAIPDANFEARLEMLGYDDISGDGQVPTALIEIITTLDLNSQSIADMTGIEDFTALEELYAVLNSFTSLDLSNNPALKILWTKFTPISTLNLTANTNLEELVCSFNNLSSLDVSTNTLLTYLECNNNSIATLDVSTNTALLDLRCGNNALTSINLTNNTLLTTFWCDNNAITSLDLSQQTALTSFLANDNNLTTLNLQNGNNTNITNFVATNNTSLTCITVDDAAYSTANWAGIDATAYFSNTDCRYTAIPDANFEARLEALGYDDISADGQVPTALIEVVTNLNISNQGITDLTGIEDFIALTNLNVSDNTIGTLDVSNSPNLASLSANSCGLTNLDISQNLALFSVSAHSNQLTSLNTTNNTGLESITLYGNLITSVDFTTNTALDYVDVFQNQLTALDLRTNTQLEVLFCDNNNITNLDLSLNTQLTTISCSGNALTSLNIQNGNNTAITGFDAQNNDDLYCILVDDEAYSTTNWTNKDAQANYNETSCDFVIVDIDVFLQGALINPNTGEETLMRDDLRVAGAVYDGISPYGDAATISLDVGVADNGVNSMVDWIWVELRDAGSPTTVITGQSAVLQRDGDVVDTSDEGNPLTFENVPAGDYHIVVKHQNHLGIMTANTTTLKQVATTINFTDATDQITYGSNAQTTFGMPTDIVAMWAGNVNGDSVVQYSGVSPDTPDILSKVLNDAGNFLNFPTYVVSGYNPDDVNLDGNTQYSGTEPDTPFILQNVLAHPGNFLGFSTYQIIEQLPENE
jgi:Leucine-rich repeat (LRR) protein